MGGSGRKVRVWEEGGVVYYELSGDGNNFRGKTILLPGKKKWGCSRGEITAGIQVK